ncbi:MAG: hypothetical protein M3O31_11440 [Acidobacteriota bacterium]|nr:hypothetical protein [Acidobacteriota bacterium]
MPQPYERVTVTQTRNQCRHVHASGNQCGSPALRREHFCYFHHTTRKPKPPAGKSRYLDAHEPFELPVVEDRASAVCVAAQILCRIASNDLDVTRAGRLLYNLQILISLMPKEPRMPAPPPQAAEPLPIEELVYDQTSGFIAPVTPLVEENQENALTSPATGAPLTLQAAASSPTQDPAPKPPSPANYPPPPADESRSTHPACPATRQSDS